MCNTLCNGWTTSPDNLVSCPIIVLEIGEHFIVRYKGVASRSGDREVEVGPVEEHAGMSNAVSSPCHCPL